MSLTCKTCHRTDCSMLSNGDCYDCYRPKQEAWQKKLAVRQDPAQFDIGKIVRVLLRFVWQHECEIIRDYMPPFPQKDTRPTCVVRWRKDENASYDYLRYSNGPAQGFFWDVYGDDMHSPELALLALSQAPPPTRIDYCIPTHGN